jgi:hypothetical protein
MRKVYHKYRKTFDKSTAFRMDPNPGVHHAYLVKHQKGGGEFCWSDHAFRVHANVENGDYRCECRQWEHTGKEFRMDSLASGHYMLWFRFFVCM